MTCPVTHDLLRRFLTEPDNTTDRRVLRAHLDSCPPCWSTWNRYRWDQAAGTPLYRDLKTFLGHRFVRYLDSSHALAQEWDNTAPTTHGETADFFRNSLAYLYNLVIWEASGNRPDYLRSANQFLTHAAARVILDYGCGIGTDTLALQHRGFHVIPCDYNSPSTQFFLWRAHQLGRPIKVHEPHQLPPEPTPDTLWIIDTLDHLPDIHTSLGPILSQVRNVITENITTQRAHGTQRFHHRRSPDQINTTFRHYNLHPTPHRTTHPLSYWTAAPPAAKHHWAVAGTYRARARPML
jgi:SAM-dependent methyltransferase